MQSEHVNRSVVMEEQIGTCEKCGDTLERELAVACPDAEVCLDCMGPNERRQLESDLRLAQQVNLSLLPRVVSRVGSWEVGIHYRSSRILSGDFYDIALRDTRLSVTVGDVAGKGLPAGLLRAGLQATMRALSRTTRSPATLLEEVNRQFLSFSHPGRFASVFHAVVEAERVVYSNGGHLPALLRRASGSWEKLESTGTVLGILDGLQYEERSRPLGAGDLLVLFTDGITEAQDPDGAFFEEQGIIRTVNAIADLSAQNMADRLAEELSVFSPMPPGDDRTLVIVRCFNIGGKERSK